LYRRQSRRNRAAVLLVPVGFTVATVVALYTGLDEAGTIRGRQRVAVVADVGPDDERPGFGRRLLWRAEMPLDRLPHEGAKGLFVH
jgi:hypothetical protein